MFQSTLEGLSTELLIKIFQYLDIADLCRLRRTCKRFNEVVSTWDRILLKHITPLVTNQRSTIFLTRCFNNQLSQFDKIRISKNWRIGRYKEKSLLFVKRKYIPWLHLKSDSVWLSRGKKVFNYKRERNYVKVEKPAILLQGKSDADVVHFQVKNNFIVSGQRDGNMWLACLRDNKLIFDVNDCHDSDINSVDISACGSLIVSGSRENCLKVWKARWDSSEALSQAVCHPLQDRVSRVSLSDQTSLLAVGTSGNNNINSLFVYDIERIADSNHVELPSTNYGMGILDVKWDGPHTLWSCGYDTYLKRWDLRTGKCEQIFRDPHASALYCLDYDNFNTLMTGTQLHGRVILWDVRQKNSVQLYFMDSCKNGRYQKSSPIYSLSFDSECLFTATDRHLNVLDFSVYNGDIKDYSICCR